jgi:hypothetical protein
MILDALDQASFCKVEQTKFKKDTWAVVNHVAIQDEDLPESNNMLCAFDGDKFHE